ncbi:hypothetical protein [Arthrobacter sp. ES1]|uniref:hypothetical protein n=1 Tax=Arthrobacter sp. ES1 TaxID=1897056 RepID=UPI001CFFF842|nr:hypothetical protein [Arthrobacter sp. ES1]MCB5280356.1 hypothetical protein [Arthrobacter sp. ES1]
MWGSAVGCAQLIRNTLDGVSVTEPDSESHTDRYRDARTHGFTCRSEVFAVLQREPRLPDHGDRLQGRLGKPV